MDATHVDATLLCPSCRGRLSVDSAAAYLCRKLQWRTFRGVDNDIVDLVGEPDQSSGEQRYVRSPEASYAEHLGAHGERLVRVMGRNWGRYDEL